MGLRFKSFYRTIGLRFTGFEGTNGSRTEWLSDEEGTADLGVYMLVQQEQESKRKRKSKSKSKNTSGEEQQPVKKKVTGC